MGKLDELGDLWFGRPESIGEEMRYIGLEQSHRIRRTGKFRKDYLPDWYRSVKHAYKVLVGNNALPGGIEREDLYHVTRAAREVMEDNLTPIKTFKTGSGYKDASIVGGSLQMVLHFNKYTVLRPGGRVECTPLSRYKTPLEDKKFSVSVDFDTSVPLGGPWIPQIQWAMDYNIMEKAFGDKDYYGTAIKPGKMLWVRAKFERKDADSETAYHGVPEKMA